jgi:acetyltransferase-like isoleucine patch superfamily enzyme
MEVIQVASRGVALLRARLLFRGCKIGARVHAGARVHVVAKGDVRIGNHVQFFTGVVPSSIVCDEGGELLVGDTCLINYGAMIRATKSVRIGARCMIASFASIRDYDGQRVAPVVVGDDVWIAHGALIEPGVTIGDGSVVSAGSVVWKDVPPRMIAIGNPATTVPLAALKTAS